MNCPKCENILEPDEVLLEESHGGMTQYYCHECDIWINENGKINPKRVRREQEGLQQDVSESEMFDPGEN